MVSACNFIKKETPEPQVFSCELYKISKNTFFTEHLWTTATGRQKNILGALFFLTFINTLSNLTITLWINTLFTAKY